jgi:hypothetical protein
VLLAGLHMRAGGAALEWQRDLVDPYAFHVEVPAGVRRVDMSFDFLGLLNPVAGRR